MAHALVLNAEDAAGESSPELTYLLSDLLLQVRRVFGAATLHTVRGGDGGEALASALGDGGFSHALLLAPGAVLLRPASLRRMAAAVDGAGAASGPVPAAVARRVAESGLAEGADAYTLSDFERLEDRFLAPMPDDWKSLPAGKGDDLAALAPAALLTAEGLRRLLDAHPATALVGLGRDSATPPVEGGPRVAPRVAGLCHEFIDYYGEVRSDILSHLPEGARDVLEIGCARGATGRFLQDELGCRVTGVELNPEAGRDAARHLHRVVVGNIEDPAVVDEVLAGVGGDGTPGAGFDALLALELFEHLVEPERFLDRVRQLVRPGGRAVFSVPNVGHHSIVRDLLAGRWDYLPIGILCYTHYRFFTRRTLADWLARCGFPDARLIAQTTEPPVWLDAARRNLDLPLDADSLSIQGFYVLLDL